MVLVVLKPLTVPVSLILLAHALLIPELYAARGANVVRSGKAAGTQSERSAMGFLADLLNEAQRELHARTNLVQERGALGVWLVGEAGAMLVRPGGRRVNCYCVKATGSELPRADRIAHLLLALRADEIGLATIANLAFSGATGRLRRRLSPTAREALDAARGVAGSL